MCVHVLTTCNVYVQYIYLVLMEVRTGCQIPWNWNYSGFGLPCGYRTGVFLQEQLVFLTFEPVLQPLDQCFNMYLF